jgi:hypothetical protein
MDKKIYLLISIIVLVIIGLGINWRLENRGASQNGLTVNANETNQENAQANSPEQTKSANEANPNAPETYIGSSSFSVEQLASFTYDKNGVDTYTNSQYGFSFDYPKGWTIKPGIKIEGTNYSDVIFPITLTNTKDFPSRGKQTIEVLLTSKDHSSEGGGEGMSSQYLILKNQKTGKDNYFSLSTQGGIGDFYDHDPSDKAWFAKFQAEGQKAMDDFEIVSASLKLK